MIPVNKMTFDNLYEATVAACAQAEYAMGGRFLVYQLTSNKYRVQYDSCKVRDGVDESDVLAEFWTHCNSGTVSWKEAVEIAYRRVRG